MVGMKFQALILSGTMYVPNATGNTATFRMNATFRHYRIVVFQLVN